LRSANGNGIGKNSTHIQRGAAAQRYFELLAARYRNVGSMLQRELRDRVLSRRIRLSLAGTSQWEQSRGSNA
jgi:hypothetical protein